MCHPDIRKCVLRLLGVNMAIFSPVVIALGIADVALTNQVWCDKLSACTRLSTGLALTWAAVAIWAPISLFFNGLGAIWISKRPLADRGWICLLSFMNTIAFGPALVIITALEVAKKFPNGVSPLPTPPPPDGYVAAYGIEITITVLGAVLFLHALGVLYLTCCCTECMHQEMIHSTERVKVVTVERPVQQLYSVGPCEPTPRWSTYSTPAVRANCSSIPVGCSSCQGPKPVASRW